MRGETLKHGTTHGAYQALSVGGFKLPEQYTGNKRKKCEIRHYPETSLFLRNERGRGFPRSALLFKELEGGLQKKKGNKKDITKGRHNDE
ncbi:MAG: hypothetical protein O2807_03990 [bacterium]|nr:hypothetical protein [bacterium]